MTQAAWEMVNPGMFGVALPSPSDGKQFLVVERLPGGDGWDWLAWRARDTADCRHGWSGSRTAAMRAAELAGAELSREHTRH